MYVLLPKEVGAATQPHRVDNLTKHMLVTHHCRMTSCVPMFSKNVKCIFFVLKYIDAK